MTDESEIDWYILRDGIEHGPLTALELEIFVNSGYLKESDLVGSNKSNSSDLKTYLRPTTIRSYMEDHAELPTTLTDILPYIEPKSRHDQISISYIIGTIASEAIKHFDAAITLIRNPPQFFWTSIEPKSKASARNSVAFFLTCFSISFLLLSSTTQFSFYSGESETRTITKIAIQLLFGILILYGFLRIFISTIDLISLGKLILYFDGLYLILASSVQAGLNVALFYTLSKSLQLEKDIYATAFESCVASKSVFYWFLRGDLEFFISNDGIINIYRNIFNYVHYVFAVIVIVLIGRAFAVKYRPGGVVFFISSCITFVTVSEGYAYLENKATDKIATKHGSCWNEASILIGSQYKFQAIAPQIVSELKREIETMPVTDRRFVNFVFPNLTFYDNDLIVQALVPSNVAAMPDQRLFTYAEQFAKATYCNDTSRFRLARALGARLVWSLVDENRTLIRFATFNPTNCQTG